MKTTTLMTIFGNGISVYSHKANAELDLTDMDGW